MIGQESTCDFGTNLHVNYTLLFSWLTRFKPQLPQFFPTQQGVSFYHFLGRQGLTVAFGPSRFARPLYHALCGPSGSSWS